MNVMVKINIQFVVIKNVMAVMPKSKFNISSADQAEKIINALQGWIEDAGKETADS